MAGCCAWRRGDAGAEGAGGPQLPALYADTFSIILSLTQILTIARGERQKFFPVPIPFSHPAPVEFS
jgi:hypothetical protein